MKGFTSEVFWITEGNVKTPISQMTEEALNKAYNTIQKRELEAYSKLEFLIKLDDGFKDEAKRRKINLSGLDEGKGFHAMKFAKLKSLIITTINSIKRSNKKHEIKAVLQEA